MTSRAPLRLRGEREYAVGPLALDAGRRRDCLPDDMARFPAVRLFVERVRDVRPDFRLTAGEWAHRDCDLPPARRTAACPGTGGAVDQDVDRRGPARRLEQDVLLSAMAPRDLPERQRTMNATVAWSYQLLDPEEQRAFRVLGRCPASFPSMPPPKCSLVARRRLGTDEALAAAARLIDKSLLSRARLRSFPTCPLYYMLETVRAYAALQLSDAGERDDALDGLARYCCAKRRWPGRASSASRSPSGWTGCARISRAIVLRSCGYRMRPRGRRCTHRVEPVVFLGHQRAGAEGRRWYEAILKLPGLKSARPLEGAAGAAVMSYTQGELPSAHDGHGRCAGARRVGRRAGHRCRSQKSPRTSRTRRREP